MRAVRPSAFAATLLLLATTGVSPAPGQSPGFSIDSPAGWFGAVDPGGTRATIARDSADLSADLPAGPRIRVRAASSSDSLATEPEIDRVVEDPAETRLGGRAATSIGLESKGPAGPVRRRVIVASASGTAWRVDLEAPAAGWDAAIGTMEAIVAGARLGGPGPIAIGPASAIAAPGPALPSATSPAPATGGGSSTAGGGGGGIRRRGPGVGVVALGTLAFVALALLGALLLARRGSFTRRGGIALELDVDDPGGGPRRVTVRSLPATLGRAPSCDVVLRDPEASRLHARLTAGPDGLVVEDLASAAGVALDGRPVRRGRVEEGSALVIGRTRIVIR